ncbi:MAG: ferrochelatase [Bacteroidetes bacterium]|nr:ferrochelatase [Bacteroidota bacterium]
MKKGVLLINLGSPDSPSVKDVRKYLKQFLNDPFVIDINPIARFCLVNFIIVPTRSKNSAKLYEAIWTKEGSPLIVHSKKQKELLQKSLTPNPSPAGEGNKYIVELGMRYSRRDSFGASPSIESALKNLKEKNVSEIIVLPLYPQYATSSTKSSVEEVKRIIRKGKYPPVKFIEKFYDDENYIEAMADVAKKYIAPPPPEGGKTGESVFDFPLRGIEGAWDFFIFSYHGLPERQITKESSHCKINNECCSSINEHNKLCYRAGCFETTRRLAQKLNIPKEKYTISFQSRLDDKWLKPYSDKVIEEKAKQGIKKILVFSPAFVADCLETIYEIGTEYNYIFKNHGGEKLQLVESLNENPKWIEALRNMVIGEQ